MGSVGYRIIHTNTATIKFNSVQFFDATGGLFYGGHGYEPEATGASGTLIVDNDYFLDTAIPTELVVQVPLRCANA